MPILQIIHHQFRDKCPVIIPAFLEIAGMHPYHIHVLLFVHAFDAEEDRTSALATTCVNIIYQIICANFYYLSPVAHYQRPLEYVMFFFNRWIWVSINQRFVLCYGDLFEFFEDFGKGDSGDRSFEFDQSVIMPDKLDLYLFFLDLVRFITLEVLHQVGINGTYSKILDFIAVRRGELAMELEMEGNGHAFQYFFGHFICLVEWMGGCENQIVHDECSSGSCRNVLVLSLLDKG